MSIARALAMRHATFAVLLAGLGASVSFFVPRSAEACWACTGDNECPTGFSCEQNIGCMPTVDCNADSDCAAGMRCVTETATECAGSDTSTCHPINSCAPIWQAGCSSDADCGDGFTCTPNGSMCNSEGCGTISVCQAKEQNGISCNSDSDCPSCWSCLDSSDTGQACENPGGPETNGGPPTASGGSGSASSGSTSSGATDSSGKICRPPYWGLSVSYEGSAPQSTATSGAAGGSSGSSVLGSANLCPNLAATRAGYSGLDPKSGGSGSAGGCSVGRAPGSNDDTPPWALGAAIAGLALLSSRKRAC